jgi:hypothetical protein
MPVSARAVMTAPLVALLACSSGFVAAGDRLDAITSTKGSGGRPAKPPAKNSLSNSKLSIHTAMGTDSWTVINQARPRVIKLLDNFGDDVVQMKAAVPGMQVVGRIYLANQPTDGDPAATALAWLQQVGVGRSSRHLKACAGVIAALPLPPRTCHRLQSTYRR